MLKRFKPSKSQLRALVTHTPIWGGGGGGVAQGALELLLPQIR